MVFAKVTAMRKWLGQIIFHLSERELELARAAHLIVSCVTLTLAVCCS